jgi:molybdenum cofactor cytidylyltransferase
LIKAETAIIILAAGNSSRLGRPKQLLPVGDDTLIGRIVGVALHAATGRVIVVTGAHEVPIREALANKDITIIQNRHWEEGMSSSIRSGIAALAGMEPTPSNVILCVCDQPFVSPELFLQLIAAKEECGKGIIACTYADTIGVPVLFDSRYFYTLQNLRANEGAKSLLFRYREDVGTIAFREGARDIDTEEDYRKFLEA